MKKIRLLMTGFMLVFSALHVMAQNIQVKGTVTDASNGEPIPFASIQIKGTMTGTSTDVKGNYSIGAPANGTLIFSFVGYKTKEVAINGRAIVNAEMAPSAESLDDVLIVAYGTAKKESFTGSAQSINGAKLEKRSVANITKALDGLAAGLQSTSGSGQPGAGTAIRIRGFGSLNASTSPLYVVDGIPYDGNINAITSSDIESMTVLKDASAGALYGSRGANGVIIITTKKGNEGNVTVNLKANLGVASRAIPRYETLDAYQWTEDIYYMYKNVYRDAGMTGMAAGIAAINEMTTGATKIFGNKQQYNPFTVAPLSLIDHNTGKIVNEAQLKWNDDWLGESTAKAPVRQEYQMSLSGGNAKSKYMFSIGYLGEEGLVKTTKFERYSGRANVDSQVNDWFKTGINVNFAQNKTNSTQLGSGQSSSTAYANIFYTCQMMSPIYPMYARDENNNILLDKNGEKVYDWGEDRPSGASAGWNPLANLKADKRYAIADNLSGRTFMEFGGLKDGVIKGLKFSVNFGFDYVSSKSLTYWNPYFGDGKSSKGVAAISDGRTFSFTFNQLLTYNRKFGKHNIDILAGHELYKYNYKNLYGEKNGFPFGGFYELSAATTISSANSYTHNYIVESYLSRITYDFADKYYISGSFRRDGSSRFFKDNREDNFWSVGGSWRISQENFMKDIAWINNLTLKASYGVQGNDALLDGSGYNIYYAWQAFYDLGRPNGANPGASVSSLENKNLSWERNENINVGIETRLFDRLSATVEYYQRYTKDMLMDYPMAASLGFTGYSKNIGNMKNTGLELSITGDILKNEKIRWSMTWMGSTVKNKVQNLADKPEIITGNYIIREGETIHSFYLAESAGVDPANGNKLYWIWDTDKDGNKGEKYITSDYTKALKCKSIVGNRIPKIYGSWSNEFQFGNFDLSLMTTYSIGGKMLDGVYSGMLYSSYIGQTGHKDRLKAWKKPGDITDIPKIVYNGSAKIASTSDELVDASYFAIKNLTVGYTLPAKWLKAINMQALRLSLTADNLYIFTARKGLDPQYNFSGGTGYSYTPSRTISIGLDLKF